MSDPVSDNEKPLDPAAEQFLRRARILMVIAGITTMIAIAAVIGVIGYRVFRAEGSIAAADMTALLPKGARVVSTSVAEDRIVVTIEVAGALEIRTFDLRTLRPAGRLRFATEP